MKQWRDQQSTGLQPITRLMGLNPGANCATAAACMRCAERAVALHGCAPSETIAFACGFDMPRPHGGGGVQEASLAACRPLRCHFLCRFRAERIDVFKAEISSALKKHVT